MGDQLAHLCKLVLGNASVEDEARVAMGEAKRVAVFKRKKQVYKYSCNWKRERMLSCSVVEAKAASISTGSKSLLICGLCLKLTKRYLYQRVPVPEGTGKWHVKPCKMDKFPS